MATISIFTVYLFLHKVKKSVEEDEFLKVKYAYNHPSSCPICGDEMDMQKTQKVMFINNYPAVCCLRHTAREMTDYIKMNERKEPK
jgi:hypothetical protein